MKDEVLDEVKENISYSATKIAGNSGYIYLDCNEEQWQDANGYIHEIKDMETRYLKNCLNELDRAGRIINLSYDNVKRNTDLSGHRFSKEDKDRIVMIAKKELHKLFDGKREEIKNELSKRD